MFAIRLRWAAAAGFLTVAIGLLPASALAGTALIPPALYPAHTHITTIPHLTNQQMDCDWGFDCHDGQPLTQSWVFHLRTQDDLHRLSGWAQFGDTTHRGNRMLFALFASRYDYGNAEGLPWNVAAFSDFRGATLASGYQDLARAPRLGPRGVLSNSSVELVRSAGEDVLAMACWTGSIEVEGVAVYLHGSVEERRIAMHDLTAQMRAAVLAIR